MDCTATLFGCRIFDTTVPAAEATAQVIGILIAR